MSWQAISNIIDIIWFQINIQSWMPLPTLFRCDKIFPYSFGLIPPYVETQHDNLPLIFMTSVSLCLQFWQKQHSTSVSVKNQCFCSCAYPFKCDLLSCHIQRLKVSHAEKDTQSIIIGGLIFFQFMSMVKITSS